MSIRHYLRLSAVSSLAVLSAVGSAAAFPVNPLVITGPSGSVDLSGYSGLDNFGTIVDDDPSAAAVSAGHDLTIFHNHAGASISSDGVSGIPDGVAVDLDGAVTTFINDGTINGEDAAVIFNDSVGSFMNSATGQIAASFFGSSAAVNFVGDVGSFSNAGTIGGLLTSLTGVLFGDTTTFLDAFLGDTVPSRHSPIADIGTIDNSGDIEGLAYGLGLVRANVGSIVNSGLLTSEVYGAAIGYSSVDSFTNTSSGRITGYGGGLQLFGASIASIVNDGYIGSDLGPGIFVDRTSYRYGEPGVIINHGTIEGSTGIEFNDERRGHGDVINSGTIRGFDGTAIDFACGCGVSQRRNDTLTLLTGSKIFGAVNFGRGDDTLDFSGFAGNTVLDVPGLNEVVAGSRNYLWDHDADQVAIYDLGAFGSSTIGDSFSQISQAIAEQGWSEMGDWSDLTSDAAAPLNFAPDKPQTPAEQAVTAAGTQPGPAPHGWASIIGGGSVDYTPNEASTLYGGLVAGSHARLSATVDLGGLGGVVQSRNSTLGGDETLDTTTGVAGLYGQARLSGVDLHFSLTGGASLHQSFRKVVAGGTTDTATASFGSAFAAPSAMLSVPVLANGGTSLALVGGGSYVGGLVSGYSETGSAMNLTVGAQTIGVIDARLGLEARQLVADTAGGPYALTAKAGVFADDNFGSSSVPVTLWGVSQTVATPGSTAYGAYGGFGVDGAMAGTMHISAHMDGSVRTDGVVTASAKAGIGGAF
jgi:hypothetical protein